MNELNKGVEYTQGALKKNKRTFGINSPKQEVKFSSKSSNKKRLKMEGELEEGVRRSKLGLREQGMDSQKLSYMKNRKYLKENYLGILKKLEDTNVVKWRILNEQK